jgi:hypothetical protein
MSGLDGRRRRWKKIGRLTSVTVQRWMSGISFSWRDRGGCGGWSGPRERAVFRGRSLRLLRRHGRGLDGSRDGRAFTNSRFYDLFSFSWLP